MLKRKSKRVLSIVLAVAMILTMVPFAAFADETTARDSSTSSTTAAWDGTIDTKWYTDHESGTSYTISTAAELAGLAKLVNEGTDFSGKTITLDADIDLGGKEWTPIGTSGKPFSGTFEGNEKTISNLIINQPVKSDVGLFGYTTNGEIKNFTLNNASVTGYLDVGAIAGTPYTSKYTDINVTGTIKIEGFSYVGGALGKNAYANVTNVDVTSSSGSYVKANSIEGNTAYRTYVGGLVGFMGEGSHTIKDCDVKINVTGSTCDVGGLLGILHYGNTMINCTYEGSLTLTNPDAEVGSQFGALTGTVMNSTAGSSTISGCKAMVTSATSGGQDVTDTITPHGDFYNSINSSDNEKITVSITDTTVNGTSVTVDNNVAQVGDKKYKTLQAAVKAASTEETTIELVNDITLDASVMFINDQNITINGNGHTISYDGVSTKTAFKITGTASEMEGTPTGVTLNVNDVTFKNTNANSTRSGYAVLIGGNSNNTSVNLDQCSFNNLYCAVLGNAFTDTTKADEAPDFSITNSTFTDTQFGYSVDAVTPGAIVGAGNITFTDNKGEVAEQETFTKTEAYVTRNSVTTVASSFTDAITNAQSGDVITLAKNLESETVITLPAGVTLDGNGYTLSYNNTESTPTNGAFITATGNNVVIKNITLDLDGIKHGVQFYCTNGGKIENATINGANWTAVQVNGAQNIELINTTLNPNDGTNAYANIEFSMGKNVTTIPSLTIDGVSFDSQYPAIWVDDDTVAAIKGQLGAGANNDAVSDKITSNITNNNKSDITIVVEFAPGKSENVIAESTYEPPYTGKFSHEIFTTVGDNGAIDVDRYATEGDDVTITVSPDEAYLLDELVVTAGGKEVEVKDNGDGTYTFTMPSGDVKIEVTFAEDPNWEPEPEEPAMPFVDVNENDWFYDVVLYAYENGLMTGTSADTFAPNTATTRGMIVSMLARLEGVTSAESAGFTDVADNDWYATAVNWAASEGIVNGFEDDTFRPNDAITREQMAAILYNYADYKGYDVSARADLSDYADAASISSWAEDVLAWANAEGLINGMTATTIDPQGATTRAQTAAMFERFLTAHEA